MVASRRSRRESSDDSEMEDYYYDPDYTLPDEDTDADENYETDDGTDNDPAINDMVHDLMLAVTELRTLVPGVLTLVEKTLRRKSTWTRTVPGLVTFVTQVMKSCAHAIILTRDIDVDTLGRIRRQQRSPPPARRGSQRVRSGRVEPKRRNAAAKAAAAITATIRRSSARIAALVREPQSTRTTRRARK
jgi:hypothetical protein